MKQEHLIPEEVLYAIELESYDKFNDTIATMNDHLGDYYTKQDVREWKQAQKHWEQQAIKDYLKGNKVYPKEYLNWIKQHYFSDKEMN